MPKNSFASSYRCDCVGFDAKRYIDPSLCQTSSESSILI